jgi:hypothetical protein
MAKKNMKQIVAAVSRGDGDERRTFWTRIGVAFENRDGSWNLRLDFVPADLQNTTVQVRDFRQEERDDAGATA